MRSAAPFLFLLIGWALSASNAAARSDAHPTTTPTVGAISSVSTEGLLPVEPAPRSPNGRFRLEIEIGAPLHDVLHDFDASVRRIDAQGGTTDLGVLRGHAFFVTNSGRIASVESAPATAWLRVLDSAGSTVHERSVAGMVNPKLASNGTDLMFGTADGVISLNLDTLRETRLPTADLFAAGRGDRRVIADLGTRNVRAFRGSTPIWTITLPRPPRRLAFGPDGESVLVADAGTLTRLDGATGASTTLYDTPPGFELRDLRSNREIHVGLRQVRGDTTRGQLVRLDARGTILGSESGETRTRARIRSDVRDAPGSPGARSTSSGLARHGAIPWPLGPDAQHPIGNTYAEYQNYGGTAYLHPGVDMMGDPGDPVYAVKGGQVKAVLTTSGEFHWRVAIADSAVANLVGGYLYAHVDQPTIAVNVGDTIVVGQYLGDLVPWPVADFTHTHFARIEDDGVTWGGSWLCTENPQLDVVSSETEAPVFEPARGVDLLAFPLNETSLYQASNELVGAVDIIAHVGDRTLTSWVCSVQEIRYTIYPVVAPLTLLVDNKLAVNFDMELDTYQNGPIDPFLVGLLYKEDATCDTNGDYDSREFFHILTNSNGDEVYDVADQLEAWDTSLLPDTDYVIEVTATDVAGNSTTASMTVTTANGNPTTIPPDWYWFGDSAIVFPNPTRGASVVSFSIPARDRVTLSIFDAAGRRVRTLLSGTTLPEGRHEYRWDAIDNDGRAVSSGVYFLAIENSRGRQVKKLILAR